MHNQTIIQPAFAKIIDERVFQVAWEKAKLDKKYVELEEKRINILEILNESLTTERQKQFLYELEAAWEFTERFMQEYAYRQGLQDSRMIHKELYSFGIHVLTE